MREVIDSVEGGNDSEVVVIGKGDEVDEGGEEQVDVVFVGEIRREVRLGIDLLESNKDS